MDIFRAKGENRSRIFCAPSLTKFLDPSSVSLVATRDTPPLSDSRKKAHYAFFWSQR